MFPLLPTKALFGLNPFGKCPGWLFSTLPRNIKCIMFSRRAWATVGILRTGCAAPPIHPSNPFERSESCRASSSETDSNTMPNTVEDGLLCTMPDGLPYTTPNTVEDDLPFPPPPCVAEAIPDWDACGGQSCGSHEHFSLDSVVSHPPPNDKPPVEGKWFCADCEDQLSMSKMHVLECGHKLCRRCLNERAKECHNKILENRDVIDLLLEIADEVDRDAGDPSIDMEYAAKMLRLAGSWRRDAFELTGTTGFVCCDQPSGLQDFIHCMDPDVAKLVWTDFYYLLTRTEKRLQCGWPDCGWFVPLQCLYKRRGSYRWYCVWCNANSQISGSDDDGIQTSCPAR